jgi:hypothetical protein
LRTRRLWFGKRRLYIHVDGLAEIAFHVLEGFTLHSKVKIETERFLLIGVSGGYANQWLLMHDRHPKRVYNVVCRTL